MITSTVPGAIATLQSYMNTVATNNPSLEIGVFLGQPLAAAVTDNYLIVGSFGEWIPIDMDSYKWAAIPGQAFRRTEEYKLQGCLRALDGGNSILNNLNNAFTMLNGLHEQIVTDLRATAVNSQGALTTSGSWGEFSAHIEVFGPLGPANTPGVVMGFELEVLNAEIVGP